MKRSPLKRIAFKIKSTWKKLSPISQKRKREYKIFVGLRHDYMTSHPLCERCLTKGFKRKSEELHHKKGRGIYYLVVEFFAALCPFCHFLCKADYELMNKEGWVIDRIGEDK